MGDQWKKTEKKMSPLRENYTATAMKQKLTLNSNEFNCKHSLLSFSDAKLIETIKRTFLKTVSRLV